MNSKMILLAAAASAAMALSSISKARADEQIWGHVEFTKDRPDGPLLLRISRALTASPEYMEDGEVANRKEDTVLWLNILVPYPAAAQAAWTQHTRIDRIFCSYDPSQTIPSWPSVQSVAYKATQCLAEGVNLELFLIIEGWGFN